MSMKRPGYALATILVLMGVVLFGVGGIITISTLESKISRSQQEGTKAYYAAEAGMQDVLWRLNNTSTYTSSLSAGTLNANYAVTNKPVTGQGFNVTLLSTAANYATVTVVGTSDNGSFKAQRQVNTDIFRGATSSPTGTNAIMVGGAFNVNNTVTSMTVSGGDLYVSGGINFNQATVNAGTNKILTPGSYVANNSSITSGTISASNRAPAATTQSVPGFDFNYYASHASVTYTATQFQNAITSGGSTINFPGPVTYVSSDVNFASWARNKTLNITGILVINGNLSLTSAASGFEFKVNDPGTGASGIFVRQSLNASTGTWDISGLIYASGTVNLTNSGTLNVNGGIIGAGSVYVNPGAAFAITYNATRLAASLNNGAPLSVSVKHWEEEY